MSIEAMKQALEALEYYRSGEDCQPTPASNAITALREALAKPERQHPLQVRADRDHAWRLRDTNCGCDHNEYCEKCWPLEFRKGGYWDQREAQAQPNQAPVAWIYQNAYTVDEYLVWNKGTGGINWRPLYTTPPKREWVGLTDEDRYLNEARSEEEIEYARAIEQKLKEKNGG